MAPEPLAILPMVEMDFDDRFRSLRAAQEYLRGKGFDVPITMLDEAVHRFIEAYNNGSTEQAR